MSRLVEEESEMVEVDDLSGFDASLFRFETQTMVLQRGMAL